MGWADVYLLCVWPELAFKGQPALKVAPTQQLGEMESQYLIGLNINVTSFIVSMLTT